MRCRRTPTGAPSTHTSSPLCTCVPRVASTPATVTRPASIHLSASRLEHTPVSAMNLFRRKTSARAQERADVLGSLLRRCGEQIALVLHRLAELRLRQRALD